MPEPTGSSAGVQRTGLVSTANIRTFLVLLYKLIDKESTYIVLPYIKNI